jgi:hypothetical protein
MLRCLDFAPGDEPVRSREEKEEGEGGERNERWWREKERKKAARGIGLMMAMTLAGDA